MERKKVWHSYTNTSDLGSTAAPPESLCLSSAPGGDHEEDQTLGPGREGTSGMNTAAP